jgi:transposase
MNPENSELLTPAEAAEILKCQRTNIYPLIAKGVLEVSNVHGKRMVTAASVLKRARDMGKLQSDETDGGPIKAAAAIETATVDETPTIVENDGEVSAEAKSAAPQPSPRKPGGIRKPIGKDVNSPSINEDNPTPISQNAQELEERRITLTEVVFDESLQVRASINGDTVVEYADLMKSGERFPAVHLFEDKGRFFIGDGWHRLRAAKFNGYTSFPAIVAPGGKKAALKFALSANANHGLRRTNDDKLRAVSIALSEFSNLSNREIAKICAVSESFVRAHRDRCAQNAPGKRVGGDGKVYTVTKQKPFKPTPDSLARVSQMKINKLCSAILGLNAEAVEQIEKSLNKRKSELASKSGRPVDKAA